MRCDAIAAARVRRTNMGMLHAQWLAMHTMPAQGMHTPQPPVHAMLNGIAHALLHMQASAHHLSCLGIHTLSMQMTRTIQNYQKAYRKKVEGLKEELKTFRADNGHLRTQVRNLRRKKLVSPPSLLIGSAVGYLAGKYLGAVLQRLFRRGKGGKAAKATQQGDEAAAAADGAQEALIEQQL